MIQGAIASLVTPFTSNGDLDTAAMSAMSDRAATAGFDSICFAGGTGEFLSLTEAERDDGLKAVIDGASGKSVLSSAMYTQPKDILASAERSAKAGAQAIMVIPPYFYGADQNSIFSHLSYVAQNSALPVLLFNSAKRGGTTMTPDTVIRLAEASSNFIGIKETTEDMNIIGDLVSRSPAAFRVIQAHEPVILPSYVLGATGSFGSLCNLIPKTVVRLHKAIGDNDLPLARNLTRRISAIADAAYSVTIPVGIKYLMRLAGIHDGDVRLPLISGSLSEADQKRLQGIIPVIKSLEAES